MYQLTYLYKCCIFHWLVFNMFFYIYARDSRKRFIVTTVTTFLPALQSLLRSSQNFANKQIGSSVSFLRDNGIPFENKDGLVYPFYSEGFKLADLYRLVELYFHEYSKSQIEKERKSARFLALTCGVGPEYLATPKGKRNKSLVRYDFINILGNMPSKLNYEHFFTFMMRSEKFPIWTPQQKEFSQYLTTVISAYEKFMKVSINMDKVAKEIERTRSRRYMALERLRSEVAEFEKSNDFSSLEALATLKGIESLRKVILQPYSFSIEQMDLSVRALISLGEQMIFTISDLICYSESDLRDFGVSVRNLAEINKKLYEGYNLTLKP